MPTYYATSATSDTSTSALTSSTGAAYAEAVNLVYNAATTSTSVTWDNWVLQGDFYGTNNAVTAISWNQWQQVHEEAAENSAQREEREARWRQERAEYAQRAEEARRTRARANARAMKLLRSCLDEQQRRDLDAHQHFFVTAPSGNVYRIDQGYAGNVKRVDPVTKVWIEQLCIHPTGVPEGDTMLGQKLLIESHEETFREFANISTRAGMASYAKRGRLTGQLLHFPTPAEQAVVEASRVAA